MHKPFLVVMLLLSLGVYSQNSARLVLPVGHFFGIDMLGISTNEGYLVTHDVNNNIILWEVETKKEILRIESKAAVQAVIFDGDSHILYFSKDSVFRYDIHANKTTGHKTGLVAKTVQLYKQEIYLLTPENKLYVLRRTKNDAYEKYFLSKSIIDLHGNDEQVFALSSTGAIIQLNGNKLINKYSIKSDLNGLKFSKQPNGDAFCIATETGSVYIFHTRENTYQEIYKFSEAVTGLIFSRDGTSIFACSNDFSTVSYNIESKNLDYAMLNDYCTGLIPLKKDGLLVSCYDGNIIQFNNKLVQKGVFTTALEKPTIHRYISKDVFLLGKDDGSIVQLDLSKNQKFQTKVASARISDIIHSSRHDETIVSSYDGNLYRYNFQNKKTTPIRSFPSPIVNIEYSPSTHKYLVVHSKAAYLFDTTFRLLDSAQSNDAWFVNKSNRYFTIGGIGAFIYADNQANELKTVALPDSLRSEWIAEVHHSENDEIFYIGTYGGKIITYKKGVFQLIADFNENLHHLYFNRTEKSLYVVLRSNKVQQILLNNNFSIRTVFHDPTLAHTNTWNIDYDEVESKYLIASGRNIHIFDRFWNSTQPPIVFSDIVCAAPDSRYSALFTNDSKGIVSLCYDGSYHWNPLQDNKYGRDSIPLLQMEQIGKRLNISPMRIEYSKYRYEILTNENKRFGYLQLDNEDWLVYDDEYHFDGTENARKLLYFTCGAEVIALDQLKDQLWVPNLATRIAAGDSIGTKSLDQLNICGLTPEINSNQHPDSSYRFLIRPRKGGLGKVDVLVNGIEVRSYLPSQLNENINGFELVIPHIELLRNFVSDKANSVTVKAYTADDAIFARGFKIEEPAASSQSSALPNLYAVMVGVSDYKGSELDLTYAAKDAKDLGDILQTASRKLLNVDGKEHVFLYDLNTSPNRGLLPEKNNIRKTLEEIGTKSQPNDILLIFFAGHGVMEGEKKQFYFLTSDASPTTATALAKEVGISTEELTEWMKPQLIRAQKRILIFDACNSGQAIKDLIKIGGSDQGYLAARSDEQSQIIKAIDKLNERSGLFILSASASNQPAYEMGRYSPGLLTHALLKAIKQQPDVLDQGKYLDLSRWFQAAERIVTDLAKDNGARQQPQIVSNTNFNIGVVDDDVIKKIALPAEKPAFMSSSIQNADEMLAYDDLEMGKWIDGKLQELASSGLNSQITYLAGIRISNAWTLTGRYEINGKILKIKVNVRLGSNPPKHKFELSGSVDALEELGKQIAEQAMSLVLEENGKQKASSKPEEM